MFRSIARQYSQSSTILSKELPSIKRRRLVVTGMGIVSPLGNQVDQFWNGLISGKSGIRYILPQTEDESLENYPHANLFTKELLDKCGIQIAATVIDNVHLDRRDQREVPLFVSYGQHSALHAMKESKILDCNNSESLAVVMGTGIGNLDDIGNAHVLLQDNKVKNISPYFVGRILPSSPAGWIGKGMRLFPSMGSEDENSIPFRGAVIAPVAACATGQVSIIQAAQLMYTDPSINAVICGATEAAIHPISITAFSRMRALSKKFNNNPSVASRPFDKDRDGFVMGEGSGAICLEDMEHALARNANILCELRGFAQSSDGHHMSQPPPEGNGAALAMKKALELSGLSPEDIQYISAHGTSTPLGDLAETTAIKAIFGSHSQKLAVSSIKGHIGHLLGAAGIVQTISTIKSIQEDIVPPTLNLFEAGEDCNLNYVPNNAEKMEVTAALSNSFGFGGINTCLVLTKFQK